jgi:hypothetical protein
MQQHDLRDITPEQDASAADRPFDPARGIGQIFGLDPPLARDILARDRIVIGFGKLPVVGIDRDRGDAVAVPASQPSIVRLTEMGKPVSR